MGIGGAKFFQELFSSMADPMQILVVDGDAGNCRRVHGCLDDSNVEIQSCGDGIDALVRIDSLRPNLIVMEMDLPRLDGVALAKAIKAHEDTRDIPLIFLTDRSDPRSMIEGINVGAKYYITKPYEDEELVAKVRKAI